MNVACPDPPVYVLKAHESKAYDLRDGPAPHEAMRAPEYPSVLQAFEGEHIFSVRPTASGTYEFTEECDTYFSLILTPQQIARLARELQALVQTEQPDNTSRSDHRPDDGDVCPD